MPDVLAPEHPLLVGLVVLVSQKLGGLHFLVGVDILQDLVGLGIGADIVEGGAVRVPIEQLLHNHLSLVVLLPAHIDACQQSERLPVIFVVFAGCCGKLVGRLVVVVLEVELPERVAQKIVLSVDIVAPEEVLECFGRVYEFVGEVLRVLGCIVVGEAHMLQQRLLLQNRGLSRLFRLLGELVMVQLGEHQPLIEVFHDDSLEYRAHDYENLAGMQVFAPLRGEHVVGQLRQLFKLLGVEQLEAELDGLHLVVEGAVVYLLDEGLGNSSLHY